MCVCVHAVCFGFHDMWWWGISTRTAAKEMAQVREAFEATNEGVYFRLGA